MNRVRDVHGKGHTGFEVEVEKRAARTLYSGNSRIRADSNRRPPSFAPSKRSRNLVYSQTSASLAPSNKQRITASGGAVRVEYRVVTAATPEDVAVVAATTV